MKSKLCLLALALCGALFTGCATSTLMNKLQIGMTKDQVVALLGNPDSTSASGKVEYLTYYLIADSSTGYTNADRAYMVRVVNGRVESYGRYSQLYDLYNRPIAGSPQGSPGNPIFPVSSPYAQAVFNGSAATAQQTAPPAMDIASQLEKLKALKDQGVLTDEEFQKAKEKLLASPK